MIAPTTSTVPRAVIAGKLGRFDPHGEIAALCRAERPHCLAPEAMLGGQPCTPAADVFGLGCILFVLAFGREPFAEHAGYWVRENVGLAGKRDSVEILPTALQRLIVSCWARDPQARPSALHVAQAVMKM